MKLGDATSKYAFKLNEARKKVFWCYNARIIGEKSLGKFKEVS